MDLEGWANDTSEAPQIKDLQRRIKELEEELKQVKNNVDLHNVSKCDNHKPIALKGRYSNCENCGILMQLKR